MLYSYTGAHRILHTCLLAIAMSAAGACHSLLQVGIQHFPLSGMLELESKAGILSSSFNLLGCTAGV